MPFSRKSLGITTSEKHEVTWSFLAQDAGTVKNVELLKGVHPATKDGAISSECIIGSKVHSIFFEMNIAAQVITNPKVFHWNIIVNRDLQTNPDPNTYNTPSKAMIIHRGMEMLPSDIGTVFKRIFVVRIPKMYQRVRDDMEINLGYIVSSSETINFCGFAIYKEYT